MQTTITHKGIKYQCDLSKPLDISIPLREGTENVNCFYAPLVEVWPVVAGDFVGSTAQGGLLNFMNIKLNPHGNGTHTECVGHIAKDKYTINQCLKQFNFVARLISVYPRKQSNGDRVILKEQLEQLISPEELRSCEALIIRTLPNDELKLKQNYSGANPAYLHHEACEYIVENSIEHLLIDLPSVDREEDGGKLLSHKAFWKYPEAIRKKATISELIFVNNGIKDGLFLLNIQIASFELDVSPSKPVLYELSI